MKKNLKLFWLFSTYSIKSAFQQRLGVVLFTLGKLLRFVVFFIFVYQLLSKTRFLAGYNINQTIVFYLTYTMIDNLGQLLFREVYRFRPLIVSGDFSGILIKPYHPFMRILIGGIDVLDVILTLPYTILLVYFIQKAGGFTLLTAMIYIGLIVNSLVLTMAFHILVLSLGILTTEVDHATLIYRDLSRMGSVPMDIYKEPLRTILTFVIPIGIMMSMPVKGLFGLLTWNVFLYSVAFCIIFLIGSLAIWKKALMRYQSWGG